MHNAPAPLLPPRTANPSVRIPAPSVPSIDGDAKPSADWRWLFAPGFDGRDGQTIPAGAL